MEEGELVLSSVHTILDGVVANKSGHNVSSFKFNLSKKSTERRKVNKACPVHSKDTSIPLSRIEILCPTERNESKDKDEDLDPPRKKQKLTIDDDEYVPGGAIQIQDNYFIITIAHRLATELRDVGKQVWLGSLLLSDFIIDSQSDFADKVVLDLGAGTGLSSVVASFYAREVISSDLGEKVLDLLDHNLTENCKIGKTTSKFQVKKIDWTAEKIEDNIGPDGGKYCCTKEDITKIKKADIIISADTIYSDDLTDALFRTIFQVTKERPSKVIYIALEKRYIFTMQEKDVVCPAFDHFRSCLDDLLLCSEDQGVCYHHEQILNIPQYFQYERTKELVLWKITSTFPNG